MVHFPWCCCWLDFISKFPQKLILIKPVEQQQQHQTAATSHISWNVPTKVSVCECVCLSVCVWERGCFWQKGERNVERGHCTTDMHDLLHAGKWKKENGGNVKYKKKERKKEIKKERKEERK
jgi:hypothetical protein